MRLVIQRVRNANVTVEGKVVGEIAQGYLVLMGVCETDTEFECEKLCDKMINLRIFSDENDKTNLSIKDVNGELLIVSQFTLYADCRKGNRPSFINAGNPDKAKRLYEYFIGLCKERIKTRVEHGIFGADMKVSLENDGPFTIILDSDEIIKKKKGI